MFDQIGGDYLALDKSCLSILAVYHCDLKFKSCSPKPCASVELNERTSKRQKTTDTSHLISDVRLTWTPALHGCTLQELELICLQ